jgi:hypothetical protein
MEVPVANVRKEFSTRFRGACTDVVAVHPFGRS